VVTATNADGSGSASASVLVDAAASAPSNTAAPVITGSPNVNQTLGQPKDAFVARGVPSRDNPSCP
jgi:hypothetical protein